MKNPKVKRVMSHVKLARLVRLLRMAVVKP